MYYNVSHFKLPGSDDIISIVTQKRNVHVIGHDIVKNEANMTARRPIGPQRSAAKRQQRRIGGRG